EEKRTLGPNQWTDFREESYHSHAVRAHDPVSTFSIHLFGPFRVSVGGQPLPRLRLHKSQAVLALLALRGGAAVERDWLLGLLWPGQDGSQALRNGLSH